MKLDTTLPLPSGSSQKAIRSITPRWPLSKPSVPDPPDELVLAARSGKLVPLVGAGISLQATARDGITKLPTWRDLIMGLREEASRLGRIDHSEREQIETLLARGKYLVVAETLRQRLGDGDYQSYLVRTFNMPLEPAPIHKILSDFKAPVILTTNYDHLLEDTLSAQGKLRTRTQKQATLVQSDIQNWTEGKPPVVFKIHGCIDQPETLVLTERDYRNLAYRESGYRTILSAILVTHTLLMLGFSFDDPELTQLFGFMRDAFRYKSRNHYILMSSDKIVRIEKDYNTDNFGVITIPYQKSSNDHPEVLMFIEKLIAAAYPKSMTQSMQNAPDSMMQVGKITRRL